MINTEVMKIYRKAIFGCLLLFIILILLINHYTYRVGYGMPGGEIDFIGLSKTEVVQCILAKNLSKTISVGGDNTRNCQSLNEAISDRLIMNSDLWGVNYRRAGIAMYGQLLFFDKEGRVYKQSLQIYYDGP